MAINKKLITFDKLVTFQGANGINLTTATQTEAELITAKSNVPYRSIVFVKDTGLIWTHGKYFNCSADSLGLSNYVTLTGDLTISGNKTFSSSVSIDSLTAGNLIVQGSASFGSTIIGNIQSADKVNKDLVILLNSGTTEDNNKFTFNGSSDKTINITYSKVGALSSSDSRISQWDSVYTWYSTALGDTDTKINKWKEVEAFLDGISDTSNLNSILGLYVTLSTAQTITGAKTFSLAINADLLGNATTADRLKNNCTIELSGFVSGSASFNGSNITITTTSNTSVSGDGSSTGDWNKYITVNINGTSKTLKIPAKPTYKFSDLTEHPTTLAGYGITDAITKEADVSLLPVHTHINTTWPTGSANTTNKDTSSHTDHAGNAPDAKYLLSGNGLLKDSGTGSYLIQIIHSTDLDGAIYTGYFSYTTGSGTDEEILLHRSGNASGHNGLLRLFAKIKYINNEGTYLMLSAIKDEPDCTELTIKMKKLL